MTFKWTIYSKTQIFSSKIGQIVIMTNVLCGNAACVQRWKATLNRTFRKWPIIIVFSYFSDWFQCLTLLKMPFFWSHDSILLIILALLPQTQELQGRLFTSTLLDAVVIEHIISWGILSNSPVKFAAGKSTLHFEMHGLTRYRWSIRPLLKLSKEHGYQSVTCALTGSRRHSAASRAGWRGRGGRCRRRKRWECRSTCPSSCSPRTPRRASQQGRTCARRSGWTRRGLGERLGRPREATKQRTWSTCSRRGGSRTPPPPPRKPRRPSPCRRPADFSWRTGQSSAAGRGQLKRRWGYHEKKNSRWRLRIRRFFPHSRAEKEELHENSINPVVPRLPIEELMKVNLRRLTTSHHGDLWPPVSMANRELEMMRTEQPSRHDREHCPSQTMKDSPRRFWRMTMCDRTEIWQGEAQEGNPVTAADLSPALRTEGGGDAFISFFVLSLRRSSEWQNHRRNLTLTLTNRTRPFPATPRTSSRPRTATNSHFSALSQECSIHIVPLNWLLTIIQRNGLYPFVSLSTLNKLNKNRRMGKTKENI